MPPGGGVGPAVTFTAIVRKPPAGQTFSTDAFRSVILQRLGPILQDVNATASPDVVTVTYTEIYSEHAPPSAPPPPSTPNTLPQAAVAGA